jgi:DNA gyrase inhibitor GyrI
MVDEVAVRRAAETAWTVYRSTHPDVDTQDSRRCLLERYLHRRPEALESDIEELASFALAHLRQLPEDEC